jgi:hypothetical protein
MLLCVKDKGIGLYVCLRAICMFDCGDLYAWMYIICMPFCVAICMPNLLQFCMKFYIVYMVNGSTKDVDTLRAVNGHVPLTPKELKVEDTVIIPNVSTKFRGR